VTTDDEKLLKICLFVLSEYTNMIDGWTDTVQQHRLHICIASHVKNCCTLVAEHVSATVAVVRWHVCLGACWWWELWQRRALVCWHLSAALRHCRVHHWHRTSSHVRIAIIRGRTI